MSLKVAQLAQCVNCDLVIPFFVSPKKILFVSEAVTLAQVVRLVELANSLDETKFEVHFAASEFSPLIFRDTSFHRISIHSLTSKTVLRKTARGQRVYDRVTL